MNITPKREFQVYSDASGAWRWRLVAVENGRIVASSGEAFDSKDNAMRAVETESAYYVTGTFNIVVK